MIRIFGAALDPPNSPEKVNLKLAYVSHLINTPSAPQAFVDPYDVIKADLREEPMFCLEDLWGGKLLVDSWLTPKPRSADMSLLTPRHAAAFLEANGCWGYALKVAGFVEERIFPHKPVMIGVDHSLTGGLLLALAKKYTNLNVVVFDAHFDVMNSNDMISPFRSGRNGNKPAWCHCGNFLSFVLEREMIQPKNLWVLGVAEAIFANNEKEAKKWVSNGVHIVSKEEVALGKVNLDLDGPTYVSIDMDVGSLSSVFSARFMNCYGLTSEEFLALLAQLGRSTRKAGVPLVGMDIMEIDIHFLEVAESMAFKDYARYIAKKALEKLLKDDLCL
jgi:arginase family enzyme